MSGRNDIVSCALWRRCTQNRGLYFHEAKLGHLLTKKSNDIGTENHVAHDLRISQIKETVFQTQILTDFLGGRDFKRKGTIYLTKNLNAVRFQFDGSRRDLRVVGFLVTLFDFAKDADTVLFVDSL